MLFPQPKSWIRVWLAPPLGFAGRARDSHSVGAHAAGRWWWPAAGVLRESLRAHRRPKSAAVVEDYVDTDVTWLRILARRSYR
ncbi:MAG: hypothetical protein ACLP9Y_13375 [Mycobacterium sp.]